MRRYQPRQRTVAFHELSKSLEQVRYVLRLEARIPDPPTGRNTARANALRSAAITLLVAHFEYFLKSAFIEFADRINAISSREGWQPDPELLDRGGQAFAEYLRNHKGGKADRLARLRQGAAQISSDALASDAFGDTRASPKPEIVREMFDTVGTANVWPTLVGHYNASGAVEPESVIVQKLRHLCEARNEVVHAGAGVRFSRTEIQDYVAFVGRLASAIDTQLRIEFRRFAR